MTRFLSKNKSYLRSLKKQKLSTFKPQYSTIMSMDAGYIYPALCLEMYPNDRISISHEALLKSAPMLFPTYSPMKLRLDYFYNENRNVWRGDETDDWSAFIFNSIDGKPIEDEADRPIHPFIKVPEGGFEAGSLADYLGFATNEDGTNNIEGAEISALRFRHYNDIVNNYYLDENYSTKAKIYRGSGEDTETEISLRKRCWNKDRFTTAALEPQSGVSIGIPLTGNIPVVYANDEAGVLKPTNGNWSLKQAAIGKDAVFLRTNNGFNMSYPNDTGSLDSLDPSEYAPLEADLASAVQIPVDEFHFLTQVQRLNQRDNFWGTRDFEAIRTHFGINVPDTRLQRPTHLGYSVVDVHFSEVLQTSSSVEGSPQGNITGHSLAVDSSHKVKFLCREHGFFFVMVTVMPVAQYQQGIPRDAMYKTRLDYMWPILSQTGEQPIYEAEVFATSQNIESRKIFGFEPRYNHLRFGSKTVHGQFRTSLKGYHTGRIFTSEPNLGENFVTADPTNRMFSVEEDGFQPWWLRLEFDTTIVRRLPSWPTPSAIGKIF